MAAVNSGPSNLMALKLQSQARDEEERSRVKRKKGAIVLVQQFLSDNGYYDACAALERESTVSQGKTQPADNITLLQIIQDYEQYYDMRFGHRPKLFRACDRDAAPPTHSGEAEKERRRGYSAPNLNLKPAEQQPQRRLGKDRLRNAAATPPTTTATGADAAAAAAAAPVAAEAKPALELCPTATPVPRADAAAPQRRALADKGGGGGSGGGAGQKQGDDDEGEGGAAFASRQRMMRPLLSEWSGEMRELALIIQRDILETAPNVTWDCIAALDDAKQLLKEAVVMPTKYPQFFKGILRPWKGILLFGPPGTGKTMLAKAVATECNTTFFNISASSIVSKWRGDSEKLVKMLFDMARHYAPSTIFLDELDSIMSQRSSSGQEHEGSRRMKTELMIQMDGLVRDLTPESQVFVLGASNLPWDLDDAILRRLEKRILVGMPNEAARRAILASNLAGHIEEEGVDLDLLAARTEGYTGSDINVVCREGMMRTVRAKMRKLELCNDDEEALKREMVALDNVTTTDLLHALNVTKASSHATPQAKYTKWNQEYGSARSGF